MWSKRKFLAHFIRELNLLYQNEIPLAEAFGLLSKGHQAERSRKILKRIENAILQGQGLAWGLRRHADVFPKFYVKLIDIGEGRGCLKEVLQGLAQFQESHLEFSRKIKSALFYPMAVLLINGMLLCALFWYVVPHYAQLFIHHQEELPWITRMLFKGSQEWREYWYLNGIAGLILMGGIGYFFKNTHRKQFVFQKIINLYGLKTLIQWRDIHLLSRHVGLCLKSGVNLTQALHLCADVVLHPNMRTSIKILEIELTRGKRISEAVKRTSFPLFMQRILHIAEKTQQVEAQFFKIALLYEEELKHRLHQIISLIEPCMMLGLGAVLGLVMYALYQPLIQVGNLI